MIFNKTSMNCQLLLNINFYQVFVVFISSNSITSILLTNRFLTTFLPGMEQKICRLVTDCFCSKRG